LTRRSAGSGRLADRAAAPLEGIASGDSFLVLCSPGRGIGLGGEARYRGRMSAGNRYLDPEAHIPSLNNPVDRAVMGMNRIHALYMGPGRRNRKPRGSTATGRPEDGNWTDPGGARAEWSDDLAQRDVLVQEP
jgi:hypothetical protein